MNTARNENKTMNGLIGSYGENIWSMSITQKSLSQANFWWPSFFKNQEIQYQN